MPRTLIHKGRKIQVYRDVEQGPHFFLEEVIAVRRGVGGAGHGCGH